MKKKSVIILLLAAAALLLSACGLSQTNSGSGASAPEAAATAAPVPTPVVVTNPPQEPTPAPTVVPVLPAQTPAPTSAPVIPATPAPTSVPIVPAATATPVPVFSTPAPVATPVPANLPRITKNPTDERVAVNGKCQFVTRYENAVLAEWHFVSPDGYRDINYKDIQNEFRTLKVVNGFTKDLTLENIPLEMNGWRVYCRFSNDAGAVNSGSALITVIPGASGASAPVNVPTVQRGFEGRWAEEIAGRCTIQFSYRAEGSVNVDISWSGSAWERARWNMTANIYRNDIMIYQDGHHWVETYSDDYTYTVSDETFGGTGSFFIENGKLHWRNDQTGEEAVFIPA
ncbi:MAG: hypothetical protein IJ237_11695 [Oscillospiraceae bacterium]|nr:hypothetical protein [Oscillospiraceae bacterium]